MPLGSGKFFAVMRKSVVTEVVPGADACLNFRRDERFVDAQGWQRVPAATQTCVCNSEAGRQGALLRIWLSLTKTSPPTAGAMSYRRNISALGGAFSNHGPDVRKPSNSIQFFLQLFFYRASRMRTQYIEVRKANGSLRDGLHFIARFLNKRLGYLCTHSWERLRIRDIKAKIQRDPRPYGVAFAICVGGGVGDSLIAARFLRDLASRGELFSFDIYSGNIESSEWIFRYVPGFRRSYSEFLFGGVKLFYDASLTLGHAVVIEVPDFDSKGLDVSPKLRESLRMALEKSWNLRKYAALQPALDNQLAHSVVAQGATRMTFAHYIFGLSPPSHRYALHTDPGILDCLLLSGIPYVTVHNGYDHNVVVLNGSSTKFYSHFSEVVALAKAAFPDVRFIQIGTSTSTPVVGVDLDLVGRTTLQEVAAVIGGALCHLDVESGLVHMASCLGTPAVVVFGPTPVDYFGYPEHRNVPPQMCGDCWATRDTWMALCPRGHKIPVCTQQPPTAVAQALITCLKAVPVLANRQQRKV